MNKLVRVSEIKLGIIKPDEESVSVLVEHWPKSGQGLYVSLTSDLHVVDGYGANAVTAAMRLGWMEIAASVEDGPDGDRATRLWARQLLEAGMIMDPDDPRGAVIAVVSRELSASNTNKMSVVRRKVNPDDDRIDCKRMRLPFILKAACTECGTECGCSQHDLNSISISNPFPGEVIEVPMFCPKCEDFFEVSVIFEVSIRPA